jgi:hypothetical protein
MLSHAYFGMECMCRDGTSIWLMKKPFYDRRNPSMENVSLVERECWRFATSGSHSPQESTRRPIYTITRSPRKKLKTQEEKSAPWENNKEIEDPEIRS